MADTKRSDQANPHHLAVTLTQETLRSAFGQSFHDGSRFYYRLHPSPSSPLQRVLVTLPVNSYTRPHRHPLNHDEVFVILSGRLAVILFDPYGTPIHDGFIALEPGGNVAVDIRGPLYHTAFSLAPETQFLMFKAGPYTPDDKEFAPWTPPESDPQATTYQEMLRDRFTRALAV